jgi:hypothetical protein
LEGERGWKEYPRCDRDEGKIYSQSTNTYLLVHWPSAKLRLMLTEPYARHTDRVLVHHLVCGYNPSR